tara:strand:- start:136 stop:456 length:321 start_codon:yes stop_codon:yes gene_type:complete
MDSGLGGIETSSSNILESNNIFEDFFRHSAEILMMVVIILAVISIFSIMGISFKTGKNKHVNKIVTIETMKNIDNDKNNLTCYDYPTDTINDLLFMDACYFSNINN